MFRRVHLIAGVVGFLTILTFWIATAVSELIGSAQSVAAVKLAIPWGFLLLVPALALTGATGFRLAGASRNPRVLRKKRRMPFIAGNGVLVLVPAALYLALLASRGDFGDVFYAVQAVELAAGALNITLMALNIRDGLRLAKAS
ncbi:MAG: hypothetical protein P8Z76_11330 [Alphaproteobacteria bacterium]